MAAAQGPSTATLDIYVRSESKPTAARIYVFDAGGKHHLIPGAVTYSRRGEEHSLIDQSGSIPLPAGVYRVRAEKGLEYRAVEKSIALTAGEPARLDLEIPRFYDLNRLGWYSGDLHIHRRPEEMPLLLRAEDLNIGPTITRHLGGSGAEPPPYPRTALLPVDSTHWASVHNQEVERLGRGHGAVVLLNAGQPFDPPASILFPLESDYARQAQERGAFSDGEKPIWKHIPVSLALGAIDALGVVNNHFHPRSVLLEAEKYGSMEREEPGYNTVAGFARWMMDLYYSFLNCGFRIPVSAGSASGVMPVWPGYARVYVHLSGPLTNTQWFQDLKSGRSVATNGPLLEAYLDGQPPGAEIAWDGPTSATIAIQAHSQNPLDRTEIVYNGEVIRTFPAGGNPAFVTALNLTLTEPGWLAVRCFEPAGATIRYAHSSPFYVVRDGQLPVKKSAARKWAAYIRRLAASVDAADYPSRQNYEQAQAAFRKAEGVYRRLAE